ncbi:MAG: sugar phosphate isomerase/epimerase [Candidatus Latescibacteria bacterium]|nr:sugar phosphate isomerase/epimerase [Candidatus Latescibacterota bacterium]
MHIAGATFSFGEISLEESAAILKALGFNRADVGAGWSSYHQILPQEAVADPDGQADRLRRVMDQHGLVVSELFIMHFGKPINHPDPQVREWTRGMFAGITTFARKAGFESVMLIPGHVHDDLGQTPAEAFDLSARELRALVAVARAQGLQCNIEPCAGSLAEQPADAIRLVEAVPGLGLTLDYAHQVQLGLGPDQIEVLHPYAKHFHAKQSAPGAFQARPDEGAIDFGRMVRKLKADQYEGVICVEFVTNQKLLDAGWDFRRETARLKQLLETALAEAG